MLKQINILPARERVASELRKAIMSGIFPPGEELIQDKIAKMLGVSRMPVREAIQILATEGFVEVRPNKAAIVKEISTAFIKEHFEIRMILECEAVARAATRMTDFDEIISIHKQNKNAVENNDIDQINICNQAFHICIWENSGNSKLKSMLSQLWNGLFAGMEVEAIKHAHISHEEHGEIILALKEKNPIKARDIMEKHLKRGMENISKTLTKSKQ